MMKADNSGPERKCPRCGAVYAVTEDRCPYCGYIHEAGAERKFMRGLEDTRRQLDRVDDEAREDYRNEFLRNSRAIIKRVLIAGIIIGGIAAFFLITEHFLFRGGHKDYSKEMVWQHEHFSELDQMYEEKRYEELEERLSVYGAEGHDIWDWKYYDEFEKILSDTGNET